jgi:DNA-binding NarL/FixJ family response regulator
MAISVASVSGLSYRQESLPDSAIHPTGSRPGAPALVVVPAGGRDQAAPAPTAGMLAERVGLSPRDVTVLRFLAEGWTTAAIARELAYAESTIKKEVHLIVHRLGARNRTHAVAMAVRNLVI